ncbi:reverse transcriptase protein [Rutstroemia sp. NJR-2017a BBW]|nr:reverse transcriptase protein [Rutstroemia sp. NJR-2017a BBW]
MRTGRTGLAHFLPKAKVPGCDSGICECGQALETPRHVLLYYPRERNAVQNLERQPTSYDFSIPQRGRVWSSRWMIQSGRLSQFQVANYLLYE